MSFLEVTAQLANGFVTTLLIFGVTLVGAIPLGLLITLGSMSKIPPVKWIFKIFVWIIRGTPLMLQIILVFYGPGLMGLGVKFDRLLAVILAFIINYACYFSEIYRGGIEAVPKGQTEAGQVLGMTRTQIFSRSPFCRWSSAFCRPWATRSSPLSRTPRWRTPSPTRRSS